MNKLKGLVLKDLYLRRKNLILGGLLFLMVFILCSSVCLSCDYGNLARAENYDRGNLTMMVYTVTTFALMCFVSNGSSTGDNKCRWQLFEYTLPLSPEKIAILRLGLILSANIFSYILSLTASAIVCACGRLDFTRDMFENITAAALCMFIFTVILSALMIKYKDPQKASAHLMTVFVIIYIPVMAIVMNRVNEIGKAHPDLFDEQQEELLKEMFLDPLMNVRSALFPFTVLIYAAVIVCGYLLFVKLIKRREN
ncbi:MAG: hypothetical protein K2K57_00670 [Oscillospiraceae bacterium]|nr:hypothetical protein [Oscillospiraceae bacterium]